MYEKREKGDSETASKTDAKAIVIEALAESGTLNMWQIHMQKHLFYSTVHKAVNSLLEQGLIYTKRPVMSNRGLKTHLLELTFKGVIAYLASLQLEPPDESAPLSAGETLKEYQAKREREKEQYLKELEKLMRLLEDQGRLLDYPLFKEARWLAERYGYSFFHDILDIAKLVSALQPFPSGAMQLANQFHKRIGELKKRRWTLLRESEAKREITATVTEERKIVEDEYSDALENIDRELRETEELLKALHSQENRWWSMGFAARFAERFQHLKGRGNMHNRALHKFFKEAADFYRRLEVEPSENMAKIFESSAA